jgi:hypothetical protein
VSTGMDAEMPMTPVSGVGIHAVTGRLRARGRGADARKLKAVALGFLSVAVGLYVYLLWSAPYRVMRKFVAAVERRDTATMAALAYPGESAANVTPRTLQLALDRILPEPVRQSGEAIPSADPGQGSGWRGVAERTTAIEGTICCWNVKWADARTGRPIPAPWPEDGKFMSQVYVKQTPSGWRVPVGEFLRTTCWSRGGGRLEAGRAFIAITQQAGMTGFVETSGRSSDLAILAADSDRRASERGDGGWSQRWQSVLRPAVGSERRQRGPVAVGE